MNRLTTHPAGRAQGWLAVPPRRRAVPAVRLICLPYAGGGSSAYTGWQELLGADVEVCPVELPGRQSRWRDPAYTQVGPLVEVLASALAGELDVPYALFGHSMGALVAFELVRELRRRGAPPPRILFAAGGLAPGLRRTSPNIHDQPDAIVVDRLRKLGGIDEEILAEPELLELLLPAIRADFSVCETYEYAPEPPLTCPIVAFAGDRDEDVPPERVAPWREHTSAGFALHVLPGGHFFPMTSRGALLRTVRAVLAVGGSMAAGCPL
ncbi:thioesterase II family protein [Micromonospora sp. LH3U1]|uniref:thioesterase II family protein n=1 Tax=Micromonospora sp. LH3U1 TaxID=3018339 RepID=UPI002349BE61|nr:alpha/beta fold hydrolase [Micromonospora sp. LH3U1]WCN82396.1 alpha/beta fold hydrolase [Micromonospora sp. LH3U1]